AETRGGHRGVVVVARKDLAVEVARPAAVARLLRGPCGPVSPARLFARLGRHSVDRAFDEGPVPGPERRACEPAERIVVEVLGRDAREEVERLRPAIPREAERERERGAASGSRIEIEPVD